MPVDIPAVDIQKSANTRFFTYLFWSVPLFLALMVGAFNIDGNFVQDDKAAIVENPLVVKETVPFSEFFYRDSWGFPAEGGGGIYVWRPLLPMIWRMVWAIRPGTPFLFHLLTALLHLMATGMVLLLGHHLFQERWIVWAAGALFAVHPVHAEALGEIVGQADILATLFGLFAIYVALGRNRAITPILVAGLLMAACLAKESAVVFSAVIAVVALMPERVQLGKRLSLSFCAVLVTILTVLVQLSFKRAGESPLGNLAFAARGGEKILHAFYIIGRAISMCFVPIGMSPFHDYAAIDLSLTTLLPYAVPGFLFLCIGAGALWISLKKRSTAGIIGTGLLFGPIIINSSLIVPVGTELAERLLYPASAAASAITAFVVYRAAGFRFHRVVIVLLILLFSVQSWSAQRPWRNQLDLYAYGAEAEPLSARLQQNLGMNCLYSGDVPAAAWHFMVRTYIIADFPNRVDPEPIIQLEQLPVEQRIAEGPAMFAPEDPCRFLGNYFQFLEAKTPHLAPYMRKFLSGRYPSCAGSLSGQTPP
ncbi:MAG: hypothetical protein ABSH41_22250 [Syntrophobacteraceae bacterium]